jgi:hypothetical protein
MLSVCLPTRPIDKTGYYLVTQSKQGPVSLAGQRHQAYVQLVCGRINLHEDVMQLLHDAPTAFVARHNRSTANIVSVMQLKNFQEIGGGSVALCW